MRTCSGVDSSPVNRTSTCIHRCSGSGKLRRYVTGGPEAAGWAVTAPTWHGTIDAQATSRRSNGAGMEVILRIESRFRVEWGNLSSRPASFGHGTTLDAMMDERGGTTAH